MFSPSVCHRPQVSRCNVFPTVHHHPSAVCDMYKWEMTAMTSTWGLELDANAASPAVSTWNPREMYVMMTTYSWGATVAIADLFTVTKLNIDLYSVFVSVIQREKASIPRRNAIVYNHTAVILPDDNCQLASRGCSAGL